MRTYLLGSKSNTSDCFRHKKATKSFLVAFLFSFSIKAGISTDACFFVGSSRGAVDGAMSL